jgi:hypothetical protein
MKLILLLVITVLVGGCASATRFTNVSVRDTEFREVKVLTAGELAEFRQQWKNKQEVKASLSEVGGQHFKLDIARQGTGDRWLYQTTGYVQLLSMQATPVYKLQDPQAFNRLIGSEK